ncbi:MAG: hypothetical protein V3T23_12065 [Nitrososphaerales archaeon]
MRRGSSSFIDGIQTGSPSTYSDVAVISVRQTVYGMVNGEAYLDAYLYESLEEDNKPIENREPDYRFALDHIGARRLINELALAFNLTDVKAQLVQRIGRELRG